MIRCAPKVMAMATAALLALTGAAGAGLDSPGDGGDGGGFGGTGAAPAPRGGTVMRVTCPIPAQEAALRDGMLRAVNARRQRAGLVPLRHDPALALAAGVVACDNARRGRMDHVALAEGDLATRLRSVAYRHGGASEAIAYGYRAADRLEAAWHDSPSHYPTLMTPGWQETGIAVVQAADGRLWWAMVSARPR